MRTLQYMTTQAILGLIFNQLALQQELIETQRLLADSLRENVALQKRLEKKTPKTPPDKKVFWHIASGTLSMEAATSENLTTVEAFNDWINKFARQNIRPYVDPKVYGACLGHMTRGLPEQIAKLQTRAEHQAMADKHQQPPGLSRSNAFGILN